MLKSWRPRELGGWLNLSEALESDDFDRYVIEENAKDEKAMLGRLWWYRLDQLGSGVTA
jgi:hypothetical protein